ncbi:MAG: hypothetical protein GX158_05365 [Bacteroidales bacterium]|nr:hypothetical protein [Bacteroidales bacterium]
MAAGKSLPPGNERQPPRRTGKRHRYHCLSGMSGNCPRQTGTARETGTVPLKIPGDEILLSFSDRQINADDLFFL